MTIEERLALLAEATEFYTNLEDAGEKVRELGLRKATALATVKDGLKIYQREMLGDRERTEEDLESAMGIIFDDDAIKEMAEHGGLKGDDLDFYLGGFGLAKGIIEGDKESIDLLRKLQATYDELVEEKLGHGAYFTLK